MNVIEHPLVRDGKSQNERLDLGALVPETLALDDRSEQQLLAYLYEYAKSVAYHDLNGNISNWQDFFRSGVAVQTAIISQYDPDGWQQQFEQVLRNFGDGLNRSNLSPVLDFLFETAIRINDWQNALANDTALVDGKLVYNENNLRQVIRNLIASNLGVALQQLIAVANVWANKPTPDQQINYDLPDLSSLKNPGSNGLWKLSQPVLAARDIALQKLLGHPADFEQAAGQKLNLIFQVFLKAISDITLAAQTENPTPATETHDPHLGLLYAFLRLFKHVRDSLNGMTRKHLDFYYRDVLGLKTRPHQPDTAHLVFELNKPADAHQLTAGTPVKGGKDARGGEIRFELQDEIIVSKAQIQSLRTIYHDNKLYAAPVANSADGLGAAFEDPSKAAWSTLGRPDEKLPARVGLMIASPALRLEEGERTIEIQLDLSAESDEIFKFYNNIIGASYEKVQSTDDFFSANSSIIDKLLSTIYSGTKLSVEGKIKEELGLENEALLGELFKSFQRTFYFFDFVSYKPTDLTFILLKENNIDPLLLTQLVYTGLEEDVNNQLIAELNLVIQNPVTNEILNSFDKPGIFSVELTGKKGWFRPKNRIPVFQNNKITIKLDPKEGPILNADPVLLKADYGVTEPLIRLVLNPDIVFNGKSLYDYFKGISISNAELTVEVFGLQNVTINTEEGPADPKKAFLPFGPVPVPRKRFWVDHHSFYETNFKSCSLVFEWDQLPLEGFAQHYKLYTVNDGPINDAYFKTEIKFGNAEEVPPADTRIPIPKYHSLFDNYLTTNNQPNPDYYIRKFTYPHANAKDPNPLEPKPLNAPILFTLQQEFFHRIYPEILAQQLLEAKLLQIDPNVLAGLKSKIEDISDPGPGPDVANPIPCITRINAVKNIILSDVDTIIATPISLPLPPYTPIIKSVTLEYTATATGSEVTLFHLHPFEESNYQKINPGIWVLPQFDFEGALLIGLSDVKPGSTLDLLFQFSEFTADAYLEIAGLEWYYLRQNEWVLLEKGTDVLHDDTLGFIRSGIVQLALPFDIDLKPTILPPDRCWLKVSAASRTAAVCSAIAVHTQAAKAVFQAETANDLTRLTAPLKAGSIAKLVEPNAGIKGIQQLYGSYGGRAPEDDSAFYARVSEQLRHKGRAVSLFDYEQLILEAFPDIYKVKCITHTLAPRAGGAQQGKFHDWQAAAGHVTIVVVPKLAHLPVVDRLEPRASRSQLEAIKEFLIPRISPFVRLRVMNPEFDKIHTKTEVVFKPGKSAEFYKAKLKTDLQQYLSPWAFDPDAKIPFGGTVFQSSILGFIESRDYVDYVHNFTMRKNEEEPPPSGQLTTSIARAILTSSDPEVIIITGTTNLK